MGSIVIFSCSSMRCSFCCHNSFVKSCDKPRDKSLHNLSQPSLPITILVIDKLDLATSRTTILKVSIQGTCKNNPNLTRSSGFSVQYMDGHPKCSLVRERTPNARLQQRVYTQPSFPHEIVVGVTLHSRLSYRSIPVTGDERERAHKKKSCLRMQTEAQQIRIL